VLAVACIYLYRNIDSQLKIFVQKELSKKLPGMVTEIESAHLVPSKGIVIRGLEISVPTKSGKSQVIAVQEAFIACDVELQAILSDNAQPTGIVLRKLTFYLTRDEEGQLQGFEQFQAINTSENPCPIEICESDLIYTDMQKPHAEPILFSGLNFSLTPPNSPNGNWGIIGKIDNHNAEHFECHAGFSPKTKDFTLTGKVSKYTANQNILSHLPSFSIYETTISSFYAKMDFDFEIERNIEKYGQLPFASVFRVHGSLYEGKLQFPLIVKHPISDIQLDFDITHDSAQIHNVSATSGESHLKLGCELTGLFPVRQAKLNYHVDQYRFDKQFLPSLARYLPERLNNQLDNFEVEGQASLQGSIHYNALAGNRRWGIESAVFELENLAVTYDKFPYMLDYLHGKIAIAPQGMQAVDGRRFSEEALTLHLESAEATNPDTKNIAIDGAMYQIMSEQPFGKFEITGKNVPIDDKLKRVIPDGPQEIVLSLNANGQFDAKLDVTLPGSVKSDGVMSPDLSLVVVPRNCSMRYEKFQLPLRNICGVLNMQNGRWSFSSLSAENGASVILGNGHLIPDGNGNVDFQLDLAAQGLKLNDDLIAAFEKESYRQLLTDLNFSGKADVNLTVRYLSQTRDFHINFDAVTDPNVTTIKPEAFKLPLSKVACHVRYDDGMVVVEDFRGCKGDSFLAADLRCFFRDDGSWVMSLENILAERFEHDTELIRALPSDLQGLASKLQIKEPVTLYGAMCFQKDASSDPQLRSFWDVKVICHQNSAMLGMPLSNICGCIGLLGKNDESGNTVFGRLELDSVNYGDYQLTNVCGPFSFHQNEITLGRGSLLPTFGYPSGNFQQTSLSTPPEVSPNIMQPVAAQSTVTQHNIAQVSIAQSVASYQPQLLSLAIAPQRADNATIVAKAYGGGVTLEGHVFQHEGTSYRLHTGLHNIDLGQATREMLAEQPFKGKLSGDLNLEGGVTAMIGSGQLALREADIYKLPTMQRIMQVFRVRNPDDEQSAICSSDVQFVLHGNKVTLSDVKLDGNMLSLAGTGDMNLNDMFINLDLGTRIAGNESQLPVISSVLNETSKQITEIHVVGSLKNGDLSVRTQALPGVMRALQTQQDAQQNNKRPVRDFFRNSWHFN